MHATRHFSISVPPTSSRTCAIAVNVPITTIPPVASCFNSDPLRVACRIHAKRNTVGSKQLQQSYVHNLSETAPLTWHRILGFSAAALSAPGYVTQSGGAVRLLQIVTDCDRLFLHFLRLQVVVAVVASPWGDGWRYRIRHMYPSVLRRIGNVRAVHGAIWRCDFPSRVRTKEAHHDGKVLVKLSW